MYLTTTDVRRRYSRADRERLNAKFRKAPAAKPYFWQYKYNPYGGNAPDNKAIVLLHQLDKLAASIIERYGTDWSKYDRETALKRLIAGKSFCFIPRATGCYVTWPDARESEHSDREYEPGVKSYIYAVNEKNGEDGRRFFYVDAKDFYILESQPQCHTFMAEAPTYVIYRYAGKNQPFTILKHLDKRAEPFEAMTGYDEALGTGKESYSFRTLDEAETFVEAKENELLLKRVAAY